MKLTWNFQRAGGLDKKNPSVGEEGMIYSETTQCESSGGNKGVFKTKNGTMVSLKCAAPVSLHENSGKFSLNICGLDGGLRSK